jgi:hypothetical protein
MAAEPPHAAVPQEADQEVAAALQGAEPQEAAPMPHERVEGPGARHGRDDDAPEPLPSASPFRLMPFPSVFLSMSVPKLKWK